MHTTVLPSGERAHHNGDFSGDVILTVPTTHVEHPAVGAACYLVTIPFADLLVLVGEYVIGYKVRDLEAKSGDLRKIKALLVGR